MGGKSAFLLMVALLALMTLACGVPGMGTAVTQTTPTPIGDFFTFTIPAFTYNLAPGESVPGTGLAYRGRREDAFEVSIDQQTTLKRPGDSFYWSGVLSPGVVANYNLRLTTPVFGSMPVAGPVEIIILNPQPVEELGVPTSADRLRFSNAVIDYTIPPGFAVPGTTMRFEGIEARGQGGQSTNFARLSGSPAYPYLALGDSFVWTGRLRENVHVAYNLRVTGLSERGLRLSGVAELWLDPLR
jgi:hypothetical protein